MIVEPDDPDSRWASFRSDRVRDRHHDDLRYRTLRYPRDDLTAAEAGHLRAILTERRP